MAPPPVVGRINRALFERLIKSNPRSVYNKAGTLNFEISKKTMISVVVSSRYQKKAVIRNRTKRRFYHAIRDTLRLYPLPIQGILFVSKNAYGFSYKEIKIFVVDLFKKIHGFSQ